jgi:hypothetical protein
VHFPFGIFGNILRQLDKFTETVTLLTWGYGDARSGTRDSALLAGCPDRNSRISDCAQLTLYRGADKFLARPGRKQVTETEDFDVHISHL